MNKKKIKKAIIISMISVILFYVIYQVYKSVRHEVKTEPAVMYTLKDSIKTRGIIVRNEELVHWNGNGTLMNLIADGERVSKGGTISEIYENDRQAACMMELKETDKEIKQLKRLNMSSGLVLRGPDYIDKQINEELRNINLFSRTGNYKSLSKSREKSLYLLNERHIIMGKTSNFSKRLDGLEIRRKELIKQCGSSVGEILAENSGYFVSRVDGCENYLDYENIKNFKISDINFEMEAVNQMRNDVIGKIIKSVDWYIVCKIPADDSMRFKVGEFVDVEIKSAFDKCIPSKIISVNKEDNKEEALVVLSCDRMSKELILIRNEDISIDINTYSGLRISKSALKEGIVNKIVSNNGEQEKLEKKVNGVYVKYGPSLIFKEVVSNYVDSSYIICKHNPSEDELFSRETIQVGDEVVVEGTNLYDGKHIE